MADENVDKCHIDIQNVLGTVNDNGDFENEQ